MGRDDVVADRGGSQLPEHIEPMLARIGKPFDSDEHLFEIKWDGVRAVTYVENGSLRMHGRRRRDLVERYPELDFLRGLPSGTVLDGELVVLDAEGRPDFPGILRRENSRSRDAVVRAGRNPVVYVVFDLLYLAHRNQMPARLGERREALLQLVAATGNALLVASEGVIGKGLDLFAAAKARGLEGIVAKRLDATYRPGERSDAWQKIKPVQSVHCLVLGYEPDGENDFKSLIIATDFDGELRCVGRVGSGLSDSDKKQLRGLLFARRTARPLIEAGMNGCWIEAGLFCTVSFVERTASGSLRAPVFLGLVDTDAPP